MTSETRCKAYLKKYEDRVQTISNVIDKLVTRLLLSPRQAQ